jgi:hypothetical protein
MAVIIQGVNINMRVKLHQADLFDSKAQCIPHLNTGHNQANKLYPIYD